MYNVVYILQTYNNDLEAAAKTQADKCSITIDAPTGKISCYNKVSQTVLSGTTDVFPKGISSLNIDPSTPIY